MSNLPQKKEILLREYQEAAKQCRNHDSLMRRDMTIFATFQAAIIGFIGTRGGANSVEYVLLEIFGFWLSIIVLLTTKRSAYRYKNYMDRAKCIETELGMYLYRYSSDYFESEGKIPAQWAGNKILWATVPCMSFLLYWFLIILESQKIADMIIKKL